MTKSITVACAALLAMFFATPLSFAQTARPYDLAQLRPEVLAAVETARAAQHEAMRAAARAEGQAPGHTRFQGRDGDNYAGQCSPCSAGSSQRHGYGVISWPDGELYAGQHVQHDAATGGRMQGSGVYLSVSGQIYEGQYVAGRRDGWGVMWDPHGSVHFQGRWTNDQRAPD
jgi:hypothetical protein